MDFVPRLPESESIIKSYVEVTEHLLHAVSENDQKAYHRAIVSLCRGLTGLVKAPTFWTELDDAVTHAPQHERVLHVLNADFEGFLAREKLVLEKFVSPAYADALTLQVSTALSRLIAGHNPANIKQLRISVENLQSVTCDAAGNQLTFAQKIRAALSKPVPQVLIDGGQVLGGAAVAAANALALKAGMMEAKAAIASMKAGIEIARGPFKRD